MLTWKTKQGEIKKLNELSQSYLVKIKKMIENSPSWKNKPIRNKFIDEIQKTIDKKDEENKIWFDNFMSVFIKQAKTQKNLTKRINPITKELEEIPSQFFANYN